MQTVIGVDLDNTIISYDRVVYKLARRQGLISAAVKKSKPAVRDAIRRAADGEKAWQHLQSMLYGAAMSEAILSKGVRRFFQMCNRARVKVCIISHKTESAPADAGTVNLRQAALGWMHQQGLFTDHSLGLSPEDVFFEATREAKIRRVRMLKCTHFIDDLPEIFQQPGFPSNTGKVLYDPHLESEDQRGIQVCHTWEEIRHYLFRARH